MIRRFLPWLLAVLACLGVGYVVLDNQMTGGLRSAMAARDACYLARGIPLDPRGGPVAGTLVPDEVRRECTAPMLAREEETGPYLVALIAGLLAGLLVVAITVFLRRKGAPPLAG